MPDRIAIVGSPHFPRLDLVEAFVASLAPGTVVVSGGAEGVDNAAERAARACGLEVIVFRADWKAHGRQAEPMRDAEIVAHADRFVAFWDGRSQGTLNTIVQALGANVPVEIFDSDGHPVLIDDVL